MEVWGEQSYRLTIEICGPGVANFQLSVGSKKSFKGAMLTRTEMMTLSYPLLHPSPTLNTFSNTFCTASKISDLALNEGKTDENNEGRAR